MARGKKLGNPNLAGARERAADGNKAAVVNVRPVIREIQACGVKSFRGVARALTARGIATARGGEWSPVQVSDILRRASDDETGQIFRNHVADSLGVFWDILPWSG